MIEFNELIIRSKEAPKEPINLSFDKGINFVKFSQRYIYDFLKIKDQTAKSGKFIINNLEFYPVNEQNEQSLNVFTIKSQVFCLIVCFLVDKKENKLFIDDITSSLTKLKEMPLENDEQKKEKIEAIILNVSKFNVGYVLYNKNNTINIAHASLIEEVINKYKDSITFVVLDEEISPIEAKDVSEEKTIKLNEMPFYNWNDKNNVDGTEKVKVNKNKGQNLFVSYFKKDWLLYCLIGLEIALSTFLGLLIPYFFATNDVVWGVLLIILFVVCIFMELLFISYSTPFFDKPDEKNEARYLAVRAWEFIFSMVGVALAFGSFFLLKENNVLVKSEKWTNPLVIMGLIAGVFNLVIPFFSKHIRKLIKLFKNKKQSN